MLDFYEEIQKRHTVFVLDVKMNLNRKKSSGYRLKFLDLATFFLFFFSFVFNHYQLKLMLK